MRFLQLICLFIVLINNTYSATWEAAHTALVQMSWQTHWLEALLRMECKKEEKARELTSGQRLKVLERIVNGRGRDEGDLIHDINQAAHPNVGPQIAAPLHGFLDTNFFWNDTNVIGVLESGFLGSPFRDRRFSAGWLFNGVDIIRQQYHTRHLLEHAQYGDINNNDLLKVQKLSGIFVRWDGEVPEEMFSGMIQPGQEISSGIVKVISCFHGLMGLSDEENINQLFFLPNGKPATPEYFFKVQIVGMGEDEHPLDNAGVKRLSDQYKHKDETGEFMDNDYTIIRVSSRAERGTHTLQGILGSHLFNADDNSIVELQGEIEAGTIDFDRIFAFGKPRHILLQNAGVDGFCLVSDVFNGDAVEDLKVRHERRIPSLLIWPLRKVDNAGQIDEQNPSTHLFHSSIEAQRLPEKFQTVHIPFANGMSGGPVLMCKVDDSDAEKSIKCRHIGVVQGGGLFNEDRKLLYKSVIATI